MTLSMGSSPCRREFPDEMEKINLEEKSQAGHFGGIALLIEEAPNKGGLRKIR